MGGAMTRSRRLGLILLCNTAAGALPAMLRSLYNPAASWHYFWHQLAYGSVYSYCIGTLCFAAMHYVGPRSYGLRPSYRIPAFLLTFITAAIVGTALATLVFLALGRVSPMEFRSEFFFSLRIAIAFTLLIGTLVTAFEVLARRLEAATLELRTRQLQEEHARKLATEARLSSLESRIHPHFLFNTLNSISALIREDPLRAERTVERLAALLRYSLDANAQRLVPLGHELKIVRDYLEIEKTRFGERLRYAIDVPEEIGDLEVPPLALQTLVENSIKHGIAPNRQGGDIRVTASLGAGQLLLEVSDDGPGFDLHAIQQGHGLENLQDRLTALFDRDGRLEATRLDGRMVVSVTVPQKKVLV